MEQNTWQSAIQVTLQVDSSALQVTFAPAPTLKVQFASLQVSTALFPASTVQVVPSLHVALHPGVDAQFAAHLGVGVAIVDEHMSEQAVVSQLPMNPVIDGPTSVCAASA